MFLQWPPAQETVKSRKRSSTYSHAFATLTIALCMYIGEGLAEKAARLYVCEFSLAERKMRIFSPHLQN